MNLVNTEELGTDFREDMHHSTLECTDLIVTRVGRRPGIPEAEL